MIHTSVLIPQRNNAEAVAARLPEVSRTLDDLGRPYEIIVIDDGSTTIERQILLESLAQFAWLRVIQLDRPLGISAAVTAGLAFSRGQTIVFLEAGDGYRPDQIPRLLSSLIREDLVFGRRQLSFVEKFWHGVFRIPRRLLLGHDAHQPSGVFWAARSEALAGMELPRGMYRYLATFVAMRGYRVGEIDVEAIGRDRQLPDAWPNPGDLLCAWWLKRRWRNFLTREVFSNEESRPNLSVARFEQSEATDNEVPKPALPRRLA